MAPTFHVNMSNHFNHNILPLDLVLVSADALFDWSACQSHYGHGIAEAEQM